VKRKSVWELFVPSMAQRTIKW